MTSVFYSTLWSNHEAVERTRDDSTIGENKTGLWDIIASKNMTIQKLFLKSIKNSMEENQP